MFCWRVDDGPALNANRASFCIFVMGVGGGKYLYSTDKRFLIRAYSRITEL